ncbi:MAG: response regulator [Patescibacteria group bacterium]|nr:response regulator [Patescibacteria group bacterium]
MAKVLIIESDEGTRYLYNTAIKFQQLETVPVKSAKEGINILKKNKPDLVLLDVMTPDLKNFNLLEELQKEIDNRLPLIIITDLREKNEAQERSIFGACEYLSKSDTSVGEIIKKVRSIVKEQ